MSEDLEARFRAHLARANLFPRAGTAVLCVSGGPDSIAMLGLFVSLRAELRLSLAVAHVDHGIAAGSADVAEHVLALATRHGMPGHLETLHLGPDASETRARRARYRALRAIQRRTGATYLVTAHHADDQVETVLYRVLRGSAPAGLAGILPHGPNGLIRPLLPFRRAEIRDWLESRRSTHDSLFTFFEDPANSDPRHDRSWLRTTVVPLLRDRFADVEERVRRLQHHAEQDVAAWAGVLRTLPELDFRSENGVVSVATAPLRTYDKTLSIAILRALARAAGAVLGTIRAARLVRFATRSNSGRRMDLSQRWIAENAFGRLRILKLVVAQPMSADWGAGSSGQAEWDDWVIEWRREAAGESTRRGFTTWVPVSAGQIRSPERGDRIFPLGGIGHRGVRRMLMEARVPRSDRAHYPVLIRSGEVMWVPGVCRSSVDVPALGSASLRIEVTHRSASES